MSKYGELDLMPEHRTQFAFKSKREHSQGKRARYDISKATY